MIPDLRNQIAFIFYFLQTIKITKKIVYFIFIIIFNIIFKWKTNKCSSLNKIYNIFLIQVHDCSCLQISFVFLYIWKVHSKRKEAPV